MRGGIHPGKPLKPKGLIAQKGTRINSRQTGNESWRFKNRAELPRTNRVS